MSKTPKNPTPVKRTRSVGNARFHAEIGAAVVEWSRIENYWASIFRDILFHRLGEMPERDPETSTRVEPADMAEKIERADAIYFSLSNSDAQRNIILAIASLTLKERPEELATLDKLMRRTRELAPIRNAIIHAYYDQFWIRKGSKWILEPLEMKPMSHRRPKKDVDLVKAAGDFHDLGVKLLGLWTEIWEGE